MKNFSLFLKAKESKLKNSKVNPFDFFKDVIAFTELNIANEVRYIYPYLEDYLDIDKDNPYEIITDILINSLEYHIAYLSEWDDEYQYCNNIEDYILYEDNKPVILSMDIFNIIHDKLPHLFKLINDFTRGKEYKIFKMQYMNDTIRIIEYGDIRAFKYLVELQQKQLEIENKIKEDQTGCL